MAQTTLHIDLNESFRPRILTLNNILKEGSGFANDSMYTALSRLEANVAEIISETKDLNNEEDRFNDLQFPNINMISIIGNRGTGKSSVLKTFANMLAAKDEEKKADGSSYKYLEKAVAGAEKDSFTNYISTNLKVLPTVDPSMFKSNDSLFEAVVARMYTEAKNKVEEKEDAINKATEAALLEAFQEVLQALKVSRQRPEEVLKDDLDFNENAIEKLEMLSAGPAIKERFHKLVQCYLNFFGLEKGYLIIPIDDVDLFSGNLNNLLEDLRVPFMVPNVIVVAAMRLEQLATEIEESYYKRYERILKEKGESQLFEGPDRIASRIIDKLFPLSRRVSMLDPNAYEFRNMILKLTLPQNGNDTANSAHKKKYEFNTLDKALEVLTYAKTGIRFIPTLYRFNPLLPDSIRGLHAYLHFLSQLPDLYAWKDSHEYKEGDDTQSQEGNVQPQEGEEDNEKFDYKRLDSAGANYESNLENFKEYLLKDIALKNLPQPYIKALYNWQRQNAKAQNKAAIREFLFAVQQVAFKGKGEQPGLFLDLKKHFEDIPLIDQQVFGRNAVEEGEEIVEERSSSKEKKIDDPKSQIFTHIGADREFTKTLLSLKHFTWHKLAIAENSPDNISLGDVLTVFKIVQDYFDQDDNITRFVFMFKALYAIEMTRIYEYAESERPLNSNEENTDKKIEIGKQVYSRVKDIIDYLGESFYNPVLSSFAVYGSNNKNFYKEKPDRLYFPFSWKLKINHKEVKMINDLLGEGLPEEFLQAYHALGFFTINGQLKDNYKEKAKVYYEASANAANTTFGAFSVFLFQTRLLKIEDIKDKTDIEDKTDITNMIKSVDWTANNNDKEDIKEKLQKEYYKWYHEHTLAIPVHNPEWLESLLYKAKITQEKGSDKSKKVAYFFKKQEDDTLGLKEGDKKTEVKLLFIKEADESGSERNIELNGINVETFLSFLKDLKKNVKSIPFANGLNKLPLFKIIGAVDVEDDSGEQSEHNLQILYKATTKWFNALYNALYYNSIDVSEGSPDSPQEQASDSSPSTSSSTPAASKRRVRSSKNSN